MLEFKQISISDFFMAWISLLTLLFIIILSRWEKLPVGLIAIGLVCLIGWLESLDIHEILGAFPVKLFLLLSSITFFFSLAQVNGTLTKIAHLLIHFAKGKVSALPIIFFILPLLLASIGPGNIGAVAMLAPLAMMIAGKTGISAFFMTVMLINGANAGTFSPFSPTGIIADELITELKLNMNPWSQIFLPGLLVQSLIALGCYIFFMTRMKVKNKNLLFNADSLIKSDEPFLVSNCLTIFAILILILSVLLLNADIEIMALILAVFLMMTRAANGKEAVKSVPWKIIFLVSGTSMLINMMEKTGGLEIFINMIAKLSTPENVTGVVAFVAGLMSSYSSSSGVIMPTFIPIVPGLIEKIGGGNPVALVASINVGSHVVDVSPLSTLGALCVASAVKHENKHQLFRRLLIFGVSMSMIGAWVCLFFFGWLGHLFI